jgi:hypothetical protein
MHQRQLLRLQYFLWGSKSRQYKVIALTNWEGESKARTTSRKKGVSPVLRAA